MKKKTEKIISYMMFGILLLSLLPVMYIGRYNHPTGDDYYYGAPTHRVWEETGSLAETLAEAARGVSEQYRRWQGTYSAMFLMHLPPNLFGDWAYKIFPAVIILTLVGGIFYLLKPLVCEKLGGSKWLWIMVSCALSLLCVQTVPTRGESFYWYNGSMYYTGFFALSLFFLGILLRWLQKGGNGKLIVMVLLALFLAGGNYVSLLPVILLLAAVAGYLFYRKDKRWLGCFAVFVAILIGLAVSALAPGNQLRQSGMWQIPAWKAVLKSLLQGLRYIGAWTGLWWIFISVLLTPFLWKQAHKIKGTTVSFLMILGYGYGVFCSMSCPTFYTMNSTGPARAVAVVYYGYILSSFLGYTCLLSLLKNKWLARKAKRNCPQPVGSNPGAGVYVWGVLIVLLGAVLFGTGAHRETTVLMAAQSLHSGEAQGYEKEYQVRVKLLEDSTLEDVVLQPYENRPALLYVGDFSADTEEATNRKVAEYYQKNSVRVEHE